MYLYIVSMKISVCAILAPRFCPSNRWWCVDRGNTPSISRFERGRGWRGCVNREPLCLTQIAREGLVVIGWQKKSPLRLAFRAREGVEGVCWQKTPLSRTNCEGGVGGDTSTEEIPPPSRISSEGGGWRACVDRETHQPVARVRVFGGYKLGNPDPYPGATRDIYPRVSHTRGNP